MARTTTAWCSPPTRACPGAWTRSVTWWTRWTSSSAATRPRRAAATRSGGSAARTVEPFLERGAGEGGGRAREQGAALIDLTVGVGRVADALDPHLVTTPVREQDREVHQGFLARTGDLQDRRRSRSGGGRPVRVGGQVGERLGGGPGGDRLSAHPRHVAHLAPPAPIHQLLDELVELCRAQDTDGDRAGQVRPLVRDLRRAIAPGEPVASDDGHHHHPPHTGPLAGLVKV